MLVLSRKTSEKIRIGNDVEITIVSINGDKVKVGVQAPKNVPVDREEVFEAKRAERDE